MDPLDDDEKYNIEAMVKKESIKTDDLHDLYSGVTKCYDRKSVSDVRTQTEPYTEGSEKCCLCKIDTSNSLKVIESLEELKMLFLYDEPINKEVCFSLVSNVLHCMKSKPCDVPVEDLNQGGEHLSFNPQRDDENNNTWEESGDECQHREKHRVKDRSDKHRMSRRHHRRECHYDYRNKSKTTNALSNDDFADKMAQHRFGPYSRGKHFKYLDRDAPASAESSDDDFGNRFAEIRFGKRRKTKQ